MSTGVGLIDQSWGHVMHRWFSYHCLLHAIVALKAGRYDVAALYLRQLKEVTNAAI